MPSDLIIHDIKSPLSAIMSTVEMLLLGWLGPLSEDQIKYLKLTRTSAKNIASLIFEFETIRDIESGSFELHRLNLKLGEVLSELEWLKGFAENEGKKLIIEANPDLSVFTGQELLQRVLEDLAVNGIKQSKKGDQIILTVREEKQGVFFEIKDTGKPIPEELLPKIFDNLFKIENPELKSRVGTGLSFYFCKQVVEKQGGKIGAENIAGGTRYHFYLPK